MTTLYVGSLDYDVDERDLNDLFEKYGPIRETRILKDHQTDRSKGYAFVTFENYRDADDAVRGADGKEMNHRRIKVEFSKGGNKGGYRENKGGYSRSRLSPSPDRRRDDRRGRDNRRRSRSGSRDRYRK